MKSQSTLSQFESTPHPGWHAYVDGRWWDDVTTFGVVIVHDDEKVKEINGRIPIDHEGTGARQIVGELWAAMMAAQWMARAGVPQFWMHYDYIGIKEWYIERWKARQGYARQYVHFMNNAGPRIYFNHVPGHAGIFYNELAHTLAEEAWHRVKSGQRPQ